MALPTSRSRDLSGQTCSADVGRVVARIDGALQSVILVGLDRLSVCRCASVAMGDTETLRQTWRYDELKGVDIDRYGSLPVVRLLLRDRAEPLPVLLLERGQVGASIDGLITLQRLISTANRPHAVGEPVVPSAVGSIVDFGRSS